MPSRAPAGADGTDALRRGERIASAMLSGVFVAWLFLLENGGGVARLLRMRSFRVVVDIGLLSNWGEGFKGRDALFLYNILIRPRASVSSFSRARSATYLTSVAATRRILGGYLRFTPGQVKRA